MLDSLAKDVNTVIKTIAIILVIAIPLSMWKLIDILIWLIQHISLK